MPCPWLPVQLSPPAPVTGKGIKSFCPQTYDGPAQRHMAAAELVCAFQVMGNCIVQVLQTEEDGL